jgi:hypothetical protein
MNFQKTAEVRKKASCGLRYFNGSSKEDQERRELKFGCKNFIESCKIEEPPFL